MNSADLQSPPIGSLLKVTFSGDLCLYKSYRDVTRAYHPGWMQSHDHYDPQHIGVLSEGDIVMILETHFDIFTAQHYADIISPKGRGWINLYKTRSV